MIVVAICFLIIYDFSCILILQGHSAQSSNLMGGIEKILLVQHVNFTCVVYMFPYKLPQNLMIKFKAPIEVCFNAECIILF